MKAMVATKPGGTEVLEYVEVDTPVPGPDELLIEVAATAVGYGDTLLRSGRYVDDEAENIPKLPLILGMQASGVVSDAGANVPVGWLERRVVANCFHANAEYVVCPVGSVAVIPDTLSFDVATLLPNFYLTAYHLLHTAVCAETKRSAVIYAAAGGVGTALVQLCKLAGLKVIGMSSTAKKCVFAQKNGADHTIDYSVENVPERVMELTDGAGADLIFNPVLGKTLKDDLEMLAPLGIVVLYGLIDGVPEFDVFRSMLLTYTAKSPTVIVFSLWTIMNHNPALISSSLQDLISLAANGKIKPQVYLKLPLSDLARAHELLESRQVMGNIVIEP